MKYQFDAYVSKQVQRLLSQLGSFAILLATGCGGGGLGSRSDARIATPNSSSHDGSTDGTSRSARLTGSGAIISSQSDLNLSGSGTIIPTTESLCRDVPVPIQWAPIVSELMIALDRSGSMGYYLGRRPPKKIDVMKEALTDIISRYQDRLRFGLTMFPGTGPMCTAGKVAVPIGEETAEHAELVAGTLSATDTFGFTPTGATLNNVRRQLISNPSVDNAPRFVLLATDGIPTCGALGRGAKDAIKLLVKAGIFVFVLGYGEVAVTNPILLNEMALLGRVPNPLGQHAFYPATDESQLTEVLERIAKRLVRTMCRYKLASVPPSIDRIAVFFDEQSVPRATATSDGWLWEEQEGDVLLFTGDACEQLESGSVDEITVRFGCASRAPR